MRPMKTPALALLLTGLAGPSLAHTGHGEVEGALHGLAHPFLGADHLLAMVAVGLWSGLALTRRVWAGAAAFMTAMAAGAGLALAGIGLPLVEAGIVASVVVFGLMAASARPGQPRAATATALAAIAAFALFHGHAHGAEAAGGAWGYVAGFLVSTAVLHGAGILLARAVASRIALRTALGLAVAGSGLMLAV
jgi:urease accessory protein